MTTHGKKRERAHRGSESLAMNEEDDYLLHMDPSLMTERQQLAFLLRTTAHEASDISHTSNESSEDEALTSSCHAKRPKRIQQKSAATSTPIHRGRGRPPKNKNKTKPNAADMKLRVTAPKDKERCDDGKKIEAKSGLSSSSDDFSRLDTAQSLGRGTPRCALCCDYDTAHEASFSDVLFLCPTCDQKYPTQQALRQRACMI